MINKSPAPVDFETEFRALVERLNVRAVFVIVDGFDPVKGARLLSGGDAPLCNLVDSAIRAYKDVVPS